MQFIPISTKLLSILDDQIQYLLDRGQFLNNYKDAVFIYNCISIDGVFECTELIAQAANTDKYKGQQTTL